MASSYLWAYPDTDEQLRDRLGRVVEEIKNLKRTLDARRDEYRAIKLELDKRTGIAR